MQIDHTNLKPNATDTDIFALCADAIFHDFRGVCVLPYYVKQAVDYQRHHYADYKISTVIGFPLGCTYKETKYNEAVIAINDGVTELDMVWNQAAFANKHYLKVVKDITAIVQLGVPVKVIVEECYLSESIILAHQIVKDSGAFCIKTSTGTAKGGATYSTVRMWRDLGGLKIKASGGIRNYITAKAFVDVGADIIGTSHGVTIIGEKNE